MDCREAIGYLEEFLDEKLGGGQASALEAHLNLCSGCSAEFHLQAEMKAAVKQMATRHAASPQLRASLRQAGARRVMAQWVQWWVPAAAFLLVLGLGTTLYLASPPARLSAPPALVVEVVNDYIRFTQRACPEEVRGSDPHQVIRGFQGRLDFSLDVPVEGPKELRLVGGDLSYFLDRKVACLLYRKGPHIVTLSVLRREGIEIPKGSFLSERDHPLYLAQHQGFTVILWERNDLLHALVSDLDAKELAPLATSFASIRPSIL